jgi:predicted transposase/invertase (TIGR01784 family)
MQESVTYQAILAEGLAEGRAEGRAEEVRRVAMNLLKEGILVEIVARVTGLSLEQIQQLASEETGNAGK